MAEVFGIPPTTTPVVGVTPPQRGILAQPWLQWITVLVAIVRGRRADAAWTPGLIAANQTGSILLTVPEATLGDFVHASLNIDLQQLTLSAYVESAGAVRVLVANNTGGNVTLGASTVRVYVRPFHL